MMWRRLSATLQTCQLCKGTVRTYLPVRLCQRRVFTAQIFAALSLNPLITNFPPGLGKYYITANHILALVIPYSYRHVVGPIYAPIY